MSLVDMSDAGVVGSLADMNKIVPRNIGHNNKMNVEEAVLIDGVLRKTINLSNGWGDVCVAAYDGCLGARDKTNFFDECVFNRAEYGSCIEQVYKGGAQ